MFIIRWVTVSVFLALPVAVAIGTESLAVTIRYTMATSRSLIALSEQAYETHNSEQLLYHMKPFRFVVYVS